MLSVFILAEVFATMESASSGSQDLGPDNTASRVITDERPHSQKVEMAQENASPCNGQVTKPANSELYGKPNGELTSGTIHDSFGSFEH